MNPKALHRNFKKIKKRENNPFVVVDPLPSSTTTNLKAFWRS